MLSFCIPEESIPNERWQRAWKEQRPLPICSEGKEATAQAWIYQTWLYLKEAGISSYLFEHLHPLGINIALSGSIPPHLRINKTNAKNFFLLDIVADGLPHPGAHLHLVQNRAHAQRLPRSLFMPHWPHPRLIPRDSARGNRFENLSFFGDIPNLAPELQSPQWQHLLFEETGLRLTCKEPEAWHDYSTTDCVLAIRDFSRSLQWHKPATKLYNAWLAGVPFIGGRDSAYAADGHSGKDYLVATSPREVIAHLKYLKENLPFRSQLVANGTCSGRSFTIEATLERWKNLVHETLPTLALQWEKKTKWQLSCFGKTQRLCCFIDRHWRW